MCSECGSRDASPDETQWIAQKADELQYRFTQVEHEFVQEILPEIEHGYEQGATLNITLLALDLARKTALLNGTKVFGDEVMMDVQERIQIVSDQMEPVEVDEGGEE